MNMPPRNRRQLLRRAGDSAVSQGLLLRAQAFIYTESVGGLALVVTAACALLWANLPFGGDTYQRFWNAHVSIDLGVTAVDETLRHWVNDGLMAIFFFVVTLEIKRELLRGELAGRARAVLPAAAALGGMVAPALIYLAFNPSGAARDGWGIVIATDIAFALGVLAVVSRYVPQQMRAFLLAIAIFDDIAAIAVIAFVFTDHISWQALVVALGIIALVLMFRKLFVGNMTLFFVMGIVFWAAILKSGVHATVAGVILAALVPAEPLAGRQDFLSIGRNLLDRYRRAVRRDGTDEVQGLKPASEAEAPLERLERSLHPLSSFVVIPIFALANAGIEIGRGTFGGVFTESIGLGVFVGLVLGKPFGISLATLISTRLGLGELPAGVGMREVTGAAMLAGIGFTVSIFVTNLAYTDGARIDLAKAAIFLAFIASSLLGVTFLRITAARAAPKVDPASG